MEAVENMHEGVGSFPAGHLQDVFNNGIESTYMIIVQHGSMGYYVLASVDLMLSRGAALVATRNCLN